MMVIPYRRAGAAAPGLRFEPPRMVIPLPRPPRAPVPGHSAGPAPEVATEPIPFPRVPGFGPVAEPAPPSDPGCFGLPAPAWRDPKSPATSDVAAGVPLGD